MATIATKRRTGAERLTARLRCRTSFTGAGMERHGRRVPNAGASSNAPASPAMPRFQHGHLPSHRDRHRRSHHRDRDRWRSCPRNHGMADPGTAGSAHRQRQGSRRCGPSRHRCGPLRVSIRDGYLPGRNAPTRRTPIARGRPVRRTRSRRPLNRPRPREGTTVPVRRIREDAPYRRGAHPLPPKLRDGAPRLEVARGRSGEPAPSAGGRAQVGFRLSGRTRDDPPRPGASQTAEPSRGSSSRMRWCSAGCRPTGGTPSCYALPASR